MIRFLADMGVSQGVTSWLREQNRDVVHLREVGLERLPDEEIFQKAIHEQRVILTFDLDFGEILALSGGKIVSIIVFRLNNTRTPFVIQRLDTVLLDVENDLHEGAIIVVEDGRYRIRKLPLESI